jgi:hypothetical protein
MDRADQDHSTPPGSPISKEKSNGDAEKEEQEDPGEMHQFVAGGMAEAVAKAVMGHLHRE